MFLSLHPYTKEVTAGLAATVRLQSRDRYGNAAVFDPVRGADRYSATLEAVDGSVNPVHAALVNTACRTPLHLRPRPSTSATAGTTTTATIAAAATRGCVGGGCLGCTAVAAVYVFALFFVGVLCVAVAVYAAVLVTDAVAQEIVQGGGWGAS